MTEVLFINPNSTESMTDAVVQTAQQAAAHLDVKGWTSQDGPPAIQGREDGAAAVGPLLDLINQAFDVDAVVIACFDDTGLHSAKAQAHCPVIGIGEAAYHFAALSGLRFSVVTTLAVSVPIIEENIKNAGFGHLLGKVRASDIPVLELEASPKSSFATIEAEARDAIKHDSIDAIILGCAGMTDLTTHLRAKLGVPVIDGVEAATRLAGALAGVRLMA